MKEAIIMTKVEYEELTDRIIELQDEIIDRDDKLTKLGSYCNDLEVAYHDLKNTIWEMRNRADIDAFNEASDDEFYAWANEMANKYERLDEKAWYEAMASKYNVCGHFDNNGVWHRYDENKKPDLSWLKRSYALASHGWDTSYEYTDYQYFTSLADEYKPKRRTSDKSNHALMHYYACATYAYQLTDATKIKEWEDHANFWWEEFLNELKPKYRRLFK